MSFIQGFNLSDRIYLCGDTRVTMKHSTSGVLTCHDDCLKVRPISETTAAAVAGDLGLASHVFSELERRDEVKLYDIHQLQAFLVPWLRELMDQYQTRSDSFGKGFVAIFGGVSRKRVKEVDGGMLMSLMKQYKNRPSPFELGFSGSPGLKHAALLALSYAHGQMPPEETPPMDTHLFAVEILTGPGGRFMVLDTTYGELLAYGDRLSKSHVPPRLLAKLELAQAQNDKTKLSNDHLSLVISVKGVAEEHGIHTVGGAVTTLAVLPDGIFFVGGSIGRIDARDGHREHRYSSTKLMGGRPHHEVAPDQWRELIPFLDYGKKLQDIQGIATI